MDQSISNGPNWTKVDQIDIIRLNWLNWTEIDLIRRKWIDVNQMD